MKLFSEYRGLRREIYVLFIGKIMTNMGSMIWPILTLILKTKLDMNASDIALWIMAITFAGMPVNLVGGKLADKFNKRNIICICDLVSIIGYVYCGFAEVSISSMVVLAVASLFQMAEGASYDALIADLSTSENRERAYSLSYLGNNLGLVLAPTLGGILLNDHLNIAFFINGASIALSTALIFFLIRDVHREEDTSAQSIYEADLDEKTSAVSFILKNRVILIYVIAGCFSATAYSMYNYLMPLDMNAVHGNAGSVIFGTMSSVNCAVVILFTALITRLFCKMFDVTKMLTGEGLMTVGYLIFMYFTKNVILCYFSMVIFTFGEIFATLSYSPFVTRRIPASHRGRILSISNVVSSLACAGLQYLVGCIYDGMGSMVAWFAVIGMGIINLALIHWSVFYDRIDYSALYLNENEEATQE